MKMVSGLFFSLQIYDMDVYTVPGWQGQHKTTPQKNAEKVNKFIKYFVGIKKNEVNKNCRQKTMENV
jgi:hypothetical protein